MAERNEEIINLIWNEMRETFELARQLVKMAEEKNIPAVRLRRFCLHGTKGRFFVWPAIEGGKYNTALYEYRTGEYKNTASTTYIAQVREVIMRIIGNDPRAALRVLRQVQAMRMWCEARIEGLNRAEAETLRQKARFVEALEAEIAMKKLGA